MKIGKISALLIWSENYKALADWYRQKLDVTEIEELTHPEDTGYGFMVGESYLWIGKHSKVHGQSKDPYRIMFNLSVDSVESAYHELVGKDVLFIAEPFKAPVSEKYFATFKDLDGNLVQLFGPK